MRNADPPVLPSPERHWEPPPDRRRYERTEVERCLGPCTEPLAVLGGGLGNLNLRVGTDRVLRLYRREPAAAAREAALLRRGWQSFRVPAVLGAGDGFLVLEHVAHRPLAGDARAGRDLGRALAEVHAHAQPHAGLFDADLIVREPWPDVFAAWRDHAEACAAALPRALATAALRCLDAHRALVDEASRAIVLLHGDFKATNLHRADGGALLVLDWEFAFAGPALADVGQLLRWSAPACFVDAFASAYRDAGGWLPAGWRRAAEILGLVNLLGLAAGSAPGSRRARDLRARIGATAEG